jgi:predicted AAA+ superfamily ATPase
MCVAPSYAWDETKRRHNNRRPCKFHISNLLAAVAWHPNHIRTPEDVIALNGNMKGILLEWLIAQECSRRACVQGVEMPEVMAHWQGKKHEIDFVIQKERFIEVKLGKAGPLDFIWFPKIFPNEKLTVICANRFETDTLIGITIEDFLLSD